MILSLNSLFHKENTLFKEEYYASSKSILFTWLSMAYYPPVSQERIPAEICPRSWMLARLVIRGKKSAMGCVY